MLADAGGPAGVGPASPANGEGERDAHGEGSLRALEAEA